LDAFFSEEVTALVRNRFEIQNGINDQIFQDLCNRVRKRGVIAANSTIKHKHMAPAILSILMSIIAIIGAYVMVIYLRKYGNIERMAMIEKGLDPKLFAVEKKPLNTSWSLRFALLLMGAGVGLLLGHFLDRTYDMEEVAYFSMLFICGGAGLGTSYIIEESKMRRAEKK